MNYEEHLQNLQDLLLKVQNKIKEIRSNKERDINFDYLKSLFLLENQIVQQMSMPELLSLVPKQMSVKPGDKISLIP